ncbi:MAG: M16 family metallopeptidase, partial [Leadbetterella sp.]
MSEYQIYTLPNGIRIAHRSIPHTKIVHCGIMLNVGSRDENESQAGLAHFWEHMAFKGTKKRKAYHIINSLEAVGGELNAYTTKEKICFYASVLENYFEKAIDVLSDITFGSIFPEKQLEIERGVILEEMSMYLDSAEDAIQDEFDAYIFPNHPLGVNILGTEQTVKKFKRSDFEDFINQNIDTEKIVVAVVG